MASGLGDYASIQVSDAETASGYDGDTDMSNYRAILSSLILATVEDIVQPVPGISMSEPPISDKKAHRQWMNQCARADMANDNRESALRWINGYPLVLGHEESNGGKQHLLYFDDACELIGFPANAVRKGIRDIPQEIMENIRKHRNGLVRDCDEKADNPHSEEFEFA